MVAINKNNLISNSDLGIPCIPAAGQAGQILEYAGRVPPGWPPAWRRPCPGPNGRRPAAAHWLSRTADAALLPWQTTTPPPCPRKIETK